jgi:hypothetical protein
MTLRRNKAERVRTDVDETEEWFCVKPYGHEENHYVENADHTAGMAVALTPAEVEYRRGRADGAADPLRILQETATWLRSQATALRKQASDCQEAAEQVERRVRRIVLGVADPLLKCGHCQRLSTSDPCDYCGRGVNDQV